MAGKDNSAERLVLMCRFHLLETITLNSENIIHTFINLAHSGFVLSHIIYRHNESIAELDTLIVFYN